MGYKWYILWMVCNNGFFVYKNFKSNINLLNKIIEINYKKVVGFRLKIMDVGWIFFEM